MVTTLISSIALVITLFKKCYKCCNSKKQNKNRVIDETTINRHEPRGITVSNTSITMRSQNRSTGYRNSEVSSHHIVSNITDDKPVKIIRRRQGIGEVPIYEKFEKAYAEFRTKNNQLYQ